MKTYKNLKNDSFIYRPRPENIILNTKLCIRIELSKFDLISLLGETIFFSVPNWLREKKSQKSIFLTGKVTNISKSKKSIELNFNSDNWFPVSQMNDVYLYKPKGSKQKLLTEFEFK